ncbi:hypothetical protein ABFT23_15445 [Nocardioides sp. C4-1]|uniref:hypothetical protein n=1 Tax=Nocardioides sp. C4-1 TaxID=3151851 RepID=UPI003263B44B
MSTDESVRAEPADDATPDDDDPASGRRRGRRRRARRDDVATVPVAATSGDDATSDAPVFVSTATDAGSEHDETSSGPRFWHRSHPVFTPLTGFFTGVLTVVVVLGLLGVILEVVIGYDIGDHPWVFLVALGVLLAINLALVVAPGTRRFARYMLYGIITTPVLVAVTAALTFYVALEG